MEKFVDSYNFVEFLVFCGFFDIDLIVQEGWYKCDLLFYYCIEGYKISGRLFGFEVEFGYESRYNVVNFFEVIFCQRGYVFCLKKLYNEIIELINDLLVIRFIIKILCEMFELDIFDIIRDFLNF